MPPEVDGAAGGGGFPDGRASSEGLGGVRAGAGDGVRVDAVEGAVRALLREDQHARELRGGGDGLRGAGGAADAADDGREEQAGVPVGPHLRDEHRGPQGRQDRLPDAHGPRQGVPGHRLHDGRRGEEVSRREEEEGGGRGTERSR